MSVNIEDGILEAAELLKRQRKLQVEHQHGKNPNDYDFKVKLIVYLKQINKKNPKDKTTIQIVSDEI